MTKLNIYNKLFILFYALLIIVIIWKVPHEKNAGTYQGQELTSKR